MATCATCGGVAVSAPCPHCGSLFVLSARAVGRQPIRRPVSKSLMLWATILFVLVAPMVYFGIRGLGGRAYQQVAPGTYVVTFSNGGQQVVGDRQMADRLHSESLSGVTWVAVCYGGVMLLLMVSWFASRPV